jgi:5-methylcytosine-specific restriction protein A
MPVRPGTHKPQAKITPRHMDNDEVRGNSNARGYTYRWQKVRLYHLHKNPLCVNCKSKEMITVATDVDHIIPHRGNHKLFWDQSNWQSLCHSCHSIKTMKEDKYK